MRRPAAPLCAGVVHCVVDSHCSAMFTAVLFSLARVAAPRRTLGGSPENEVKYLIILLSDYFVLFRITMWCALKCQNL